MRLAVVALFAVVTGSCLALQSPIEDPPLPIPGSSQRSRANLKDAVQFLAPAQVTVAAGRSALVDLHFHVADGLHINSHNTRQKTLIPTRLAVIEQSGLNVTDIDFPPGAEYALALAPNEKLSVYTGDFTLRAHLTSHPGEHLFQGELRYQACDVNSCMPPQTLPVELSILAK